MSGQTNPYLDDAKLQTLAVMAADRVDEILSALSADLRRFGKVYVGPCPVHGGDNPGACTLYPQGHTSPGYWKCYTKGCERRFKKTILGFVRGVLSHQKHGWEPGSGEVVSWKDAVDFACRSLGVEYKDVTPAMLDDDKLAFVRGVAVMTAGAAPKGVWTRDEIRSRLKVPAAYFVERGWSRRVLEEYDVGVCTDPSKPFFERAVVPVYDETGRYAVSLTGRSVHLACQRCKAYHRPSGPCPSTRQELNRCSKWRNLGRTPVENLLYNWWKARREIPKEGYAVLVEGPGDLWRLEEAGVRTGLAMFGVSLSDHQQVLLECSGAMSVVVLTNNDDAGRRGLEAIRVRLSRLFHVFTPTLQKNDLGDMTPVEVQELLGPVLAEAKRRVM